MKPTYTEVAELYNQLEGITFQFNSYEYGVRKAFMAAYEGVKPENMDTLYTKAKDVWNDARFNMKIDEPTGTLTAT